MPPARKTAKSSEAPSESLATPQEVAAYLKDYSVATLKDWRRKGTGPRYIPIGRHVRYDWADVRAWVEEEKAKRQRAADSKRAAA
jgi:predicted DNA-binding transcriptional regulator AlpA